MSPTPDWNELGKHNWKMIARMNLEKRKKKDKKERIILLISSTIFMLLGYIIFTLK